MRPFLSMRRWFRAGGGRVTFEVGMRSRWITLHQRLRHLDPTSLLRTTGCALSLQLASNLNGSALRTNPRMVRRAELSPNSTETKSASRKGLPPRTLLFQIDLLVSNNDQLFIHFYSSNRTPCQDIHQLWCFKNLSLCNVTFGQRLFSISLTARNERLLVEQDDFEFAVRYH